MYVKIFQDMKGWNKRERRCLFYDQKDKFVAWILLFDWFTLTLLTKAIICVKEQIIRTNKMYIGCIQKRCEDMILAIYIERITFIPERENQQISKDQSCLLNVFYSLFSLWVFCYIIFVSHFKTWFVYP